jgi:hypothetical protein
MDFGFIAGHLVQYVSLNGSKLGNDMSVYVPVGKLANHFFCDRCHRVILPSKGFWIVYRRGFAGRESMLALPGMS